jgi:hypothetical protein
VQAFQQCNPVNDFKKNSMILTITLICIGIVVLLLLAFLCGCRKYRSLQTQYYERVSLMKTQPGNGGADRPSDI